MKLLITGDWHLRLKNPRNRVDNFFETQAEKVNWILRKADEYEVDAILQPGDMFDTGRPSFYLVQYYIRKLKTIINECSNMRLFSIYGQHDMYLHSDFAKDRTASKILQSADLVNIATDRPWGIGRKVDLYGASYGQAVPEVQVLDHFNILMIHKMILDKQLWAEQEGHQYANSFLRKYKDYDLIVCGDYHYPFFYSKKGRTILNGGCIVRKTTGEMDLSLEPVAYIMDTDTGEIETLKIPIEPVDKVFNLSSIDPEKREENKVLEKFIDELSVDNTEFSFSFKENIEKFVKENGITKEVREIISECLIAEK